MLVAMFFMMEICLRMRNRRASQTSSSSKTKTFLGNNEYSLVSSSMAPASRYPTSQSSANPPANPSSYPLIEYRRAAVNTAFEEEEEVEEETEEDIIHPYPHHEDDTDRHRRSSFRFHLPRFLLGWTSVFILFHLLLRFDLYCRCFCT